MASAQRRPSRRGVLLLVILAMLAMFGVVGMTFVLITSQARRTAETNRRIDQQLDPPEHLLDQAMLQVARGTENWNSALSVHSLLEDLYGDCERARDASGNVLPNGEPVVGVVTGLDTVRNPTGPTVPQLYEIVFDDTVFDAGFNFPDEGKDVFRYGGRVLTFTSGEARGQSTRIVGWRFDSSSGIAQILAVPGLANDDRFVINGPAFAGTGFGFDEDGERVGNYALQPNSAAFTASGGYTHPAGLGGANEDYDAVDYQNMLLALTVPPYTNRDTSVADDIGICVPIPSLHRPALLRYWNWSSLSAADKRKLSLRPLDDFHPNFDGGNPSYYPVWDGIWVDDDSDGICDYRWDVDNDGDGVEDSIWVDLGMPVRSMPDGRRYKPLFAILCVDLDGRLNLNAHGSLAQTRTDYYGAVPASEIPGGRQLAGGGNPNLPRSQGYGPADVNLLPLFHELTLSDGLAAYLQLLTGTTSAPVLPGRYGANDVPGANLNDYLSFNSDYLYRQNYGGTELTTFGSPPDLDGDGFLGLDMGGSPLFSYTAGGNYGMGENQEYVNEPYELDLTRHKGDGGAGSEDAPFSVAELERILRPYDIDTAQLPERLLQLFQYGTFDATDRRCEMTTESWDVPCPATPRRLDNHTYTTTGSPRYGKRTLVELLASRLHDENGGTWTAEETAAALQQLVPSEVLAGLRMDVNRPFGNGVDDDSNGVVDEPDETGSEQVSLVNGAGLPADYDFDTDNDGRIGAGETGDPYAYNRQLYARHLYVLAMLLMEDVTPPDYWPNWTTATTEQKRARWIAQWAINVVDFRDRDSIMTPFEYDVTPFADDSGSDGITWDVDGDISSTSPDNSESHRGLVWGCERPELLITETLAFHDRRTENLDTTDSLWYSDDPPPDPHDEEFDQRVKPQGALFVELFNPWSETEELFGEFGPGYDIDSDSIPEHIVDLAAKDAESDVSPVWRLTIVEGSSAEDDPDGARERSVYFCDPSTDTSITGDGARSYTTSTIAPLLPRRYAVVGPGDVANNGRTLIGQRDDGDTADTRRIELVVDADPNPAFGPPWDSADFQVRVMDNTHGTNSDIPAEVQPPMAVLVEQGERMSISDPVGGYPDTITQDGTTSTFDPPSQVYSPTLDIPLDCSGSGWTDPRGSDILDAIRQTGTTKPSDNGSDPLRVVRLERLANPLKPYDADTNPYVRVDSMPVDLTAFNGYDEDDVPTGFGGLQSGGTVDFQSRERGENNESNAANKPNLWRMEPHDQDSPSESGRSAAANHYFDDPMYHTLGYLNDQFGTPLSSPNEHMGDPSTPFPWLTWNNRPFSNPLEVLMVPVMQSSQLLATYSLPTSGLNVYDDQLAPYEHMLNFFQSGSWGSSTDGEFHRLLDYLTVPSRFVGTTLQGNPANFAAEAVDDEPRHWYYVPFHNIPTYREPGRVNVNTVFSKYVWQGLVNYMHDDPNACMDPNVDLTTNPASLWAWEDFVSSRRGYNVAGTGDVDQLLTPDATAPNPLPTRFANPLRGSLSGELVPSLTSGTLEPNPQNEVTLLRNKRGGTDPLFMFSSTNQYNHTDRNPYFRYQALQRLSNLVTGRSNVYAVWITVGYFEVEQPPSGYTPAELAEYYPDGYALGRELGLDTGDVQRHRAFFIYDRSIPVGFVRGKDLNVFDGLLTRRMIE